MNALGRLSSSDFVDADATITTSSELSSTKSKRAYWKAICKNPRSRRPPLVSITTLLAILVVFYTGQGMAYSPRSEPWYRSLLAIFSHVDDTHLWHNFLMLAVAGPFLEFTEGFRVMACCVLFGGLTGEAIHGVVKPTVRVRGISGAIYAVWASQLSLLALNWKEMPLRWVRLLICVVLVSADLILFFAARQPGISYTSHLAGAVTGCCISLVLGKNVRLHRFEVLLGWMGALGYVALVTVSLFGGSLMPAAFASMAVPFLIVRVSLTTWRAFVLRKTESQQQLGAPGASTSSTAMPMLQHGTHRALMLFAFKPAQRTRRTSEQELMKELPIGACKV